MLGIIVGTGNLCLPMLHVHTIPTPYGDCKYMKPNQNTIVIYRHGYDSHIYPHEINYRANIWGLHALGCDRMILLSNVGTMKYPTFVPIFIRDLFFLDNQLPSGEACTFGGCHLITHPIVHDEMTDYVKRLLERKGVECIDGAVHAHVQGPRIKTPIENRYCKSLGIDTNSMTIGPEMVLCKELLIPCTVIGVGHVSTDGFNTMTVEESLIRASETVLIVLDHIYEDELTGPYKVPEDSVYRKLS